MGKSHLKFIVFYLIGFCILTACKENHGDFHVISICNDKLSIGISYEQVQKNFSNGTLKFPDYLQADDGSDPKVYNSIFNVEGNSACYLDSFYLESKINMEFVDNLLDNVKISYMAADLTKSNSYGLYSKLKEKYINSKKKYRLTELTKSSIFIYENSSLKETIILYNDTHAKDCIMEYEIFDKDFENIYRVD